ncbi:MAG: nitrogen fixation protein NifX [Campylobacterales bacterium]
MSIKIKILDKKSLKGEIMKVAFATKDLENINEHFGWAKQFAIYDVNKDGYKISEIVKTDEAIDDEEGKIKNRIEAIKGSSILYCEAIGPTAAAKVIHSKIHPIKVTEPKSIDEAAKELVKMLNGNPPPWIKRIVATEEAK